MTINNHEPTPEFTRFLEWQVTTAMRRQDRFAAPSRPAYAKYFGVAALVVVSMLVGAGGVTAASRIQANEQTKFLLAQQASEILLAQMQVDAAKKGVELARKQFEVGAAPQETLSSAERELRLAALELKRAALNSEEVAASGKPVQDDLAAPLVGKRDFVMERLQLDQQAAGEAARAGRDKAKAAKTRFEVGLTGELEVAEAEAETTRAVVEARQAYALIELRKQFVAGTVKAADVPRHRIDSAKYHQLSIAESDMAVAKQRYALLQKRAQVGTATELEVLTAKLAMLSLENDIAKLKARIRQIEKER